MNAERQIALKPAAHGRSAGVLQRKCACGGSAGHEGECDECKKKASLQRRAAGGGRTPGAAPPIVHDVLRSPGQPLDAATRAFMEPRFGHDFGKVRVHADARAAESARAVNALAYTVGHYVVFGAGQYRAADAGGRRLIAHELSHVIQQGGRADFPLRIDESGEADADRAAADIASGRRAGPIVRVSASAVQRDDLEDAYKYVQSHSGGDPFPRGGGAGQQQSAGSDDQFYAGLVRSGVSLEKSVEQTHWSSPEERQRFIQGYLRYTKAHGLEMEYAAAIAAYPPGGPQAARPAATFQAQPARRTATFTPGAPSVAAYAPVHASGTHAPREKSSEDVEAMYRRAGLVEAANAVRKCRDGDCSHLLTEAEAYQAYRTGRVTAGLGDPPASEGKTAGAGVVAAGAVAVAPATETAGGAAAKTALERATARWFTERGIAGAAESIGTGVVEEGAATAAAPAGAAAGTVAIPIAVGVVLVLATIDLIGYTSFQSALQRQGYVILPNPLQVCIAGCHQPAAPTYQPVDPRLLPPPGPITQADLDKLRPWLEQDPTEASRRRPAPTPQTTPQPVPQQPAPPQPKSRRCTDAEVDRLHDEVKKECDKVRGCSMQTDTCATATAKVAAYNGCIPVRVNLQKKCFQKGDPGYEGHMQQIAQLYAGLRECEAVVKAKC